MGGPLSEDESRQLRQTFFWIVGLTIAGVASVIGLIAWMVYVTVK